MGRRDRRATFATVGWKEGHDIADALKDEETTSHELFARLEGWAGRRSDAPSPYVVVPVPAPEPGNRHVMRLYLLIWLAVRSPTSPFKSDGIIPWWEFTPRQIERVRRHIEGMIAENNRHPSHVKNWGNYLHRAMAHFPKPEPKPDDLFAETWRV